MVVTCPSCKKKFRLEEKHFAGRERFVFKCPSCGKPVEANKTPAEVAERPPAEPKPQRVESTWTESDVPEAELLALPAGKRICIAVLQGADSGLILTVDKPVIVIGRADADLVLNDSEVSRKHARLEFKGPSVQLRDLNSTNGTYVNEQRITVTPVENQTEFRIGATTLMLILTDAID